MKRKKILLALFLWSLVGAAYSQTGVTGKVTDPNGAPVSGASVLIKGKTGGTQTSDDGSFSIPASGRDILVVSAVGFTTVETPVGNRNFVPIELQISQEQLSEVVVTAMGIKRERKALGYSVSDLSAGELMKN